MKPMKPIIRVLLAVFIGAFMIQAIAWGKGNERFITHEVEETLNPFEAKEEKGKDYNPDKTYYNKYVIVETIEPSGFPLVFSTKVDTMSASFMSKSR